MRNRSDIDNRIKIESRSLQTADRLLTSRTETFDLYSDGLDTERQSFVASRLRSDFRGVGRRLARSLESGRTGRSPTEHAAFQIRNGDDGVIF